MQSKADRYWSVGVLADRPEAVCHISCMPYVLQLLPKLGVADLRSVAVLLLG